MSSIKNRVQLIGKLGNDPEFKTLESGKSLARFSLATNETYSDSTGNKKTDTQWHSITVWGKQAELAQKFLQKGKEIAIEGKLVNRTWEDTSGKKHYSTEIQVSDLTLLGGAKA